MKTVRITSKINGFKRSLKENNERKMAFFCRPQDRYKGKFILKSHINQNSNSDIFQTLNRVASGPGWSSEEKGQREGDFSSNFSFFDLTFTDF